MKVIFLLLLPLYLFCDNGSLLFHGNCITCHNETKAISAPSMKEVRERYLNAFSNKKDFINYMVAFAISPNEDSSIMQDKIKKYKLMPLLGYEESTLQEISDYIYKTNF